jgi:hypothetical protein
MRRSADWMHQLDERIMELLQRDGWATPATMAREFCFTASEDRIKGRCAVLQDVGFVAPIIQDEDMFELTVVGMLYLDGDLDAGTLPRGSGVTQ